jgi:hypothetical protein
MWPAEGFNLAQEAPKFFYLIGFFYEKSFVFVTTLVLDRFHDSGKCHAAWICLICC